jgi:hypothetical protein
MIHRIQFSRWWIPFDIVCLFCFELCEATVPSMHNIFDNGGGKKTIAAAHNPAIRAQPPPPTTGLGVPATHHCTDRCVFCDFVGLLVLCTTAHG